MDVIKTYYNEYAQAMVQNKKDLLVLYKNYKVIFSQEDIIYMEQ